MNFAADFVPAKKQDGEKSGFEEECKNPLRRERTAKNVADEAGIRRPVRAEFKLHHDARRHADGERERENFRPKPRHLVVERVARFEPQTFHDDEHDAQADAQRRVNIMERNGRAELDARKS